MTDQLNPTRVSTLMLLLASIGPFVLALCSHILILASTTRPFPPYVFRLGYLIPMMICLGGTILSIVRLRIRKPDFFTLLGVFTSLLGFAYYSLFSVSTDRVDEGFQFKARMDLQFMERRLEYYYIDHGNYPAPVVGAESANGMLDPDNPVYSMPTFPAGISMQLEASLPIKPLTSNTDSRFPATYGEEPQKRLLPRDSYMTHIAPGATYIYYATEKGYLLLSPGMDQDFDIDPIRNFDEIIDLPKDALHPKTYDITNGTYSDGDIMRWGTPKDLRRSK